MSPGSLRLFIAVSLPDEQLRWVSAETARLRELWPEARWVPPENQHVTLKFLGKTEPEALGEVVGRCQAVATKRTPATLRLGGLGAFPRFRSARVLWVDLGDPDLLLASLAGELDDALEPLGFAREKRPFSAHLTLARFKTPLRIEDPPALGESPEPFEVESFGLWRSHLSPRGATYERLGEFQLTRSG